MKYGIYEIVFHERGLVWDRWKTIREAEYKIHYNINGHEEMEYIIYELYDIKKNV